MLAGEDIVLFYTGGMAGRVRDVLHLPGAAEADRAVGAECEDGCGG